MQGIFVKKEISYAEAESPLQGIIDDFIKNAPPDIHAVMLAGCKMDYIAEDVGDHVRLTLRTHYPVSILKTHDGKIISVAEKRTI